MSVIICRLILDRKEAIYLKGELIKGVVELETELDLKEWIKHVELLGTCLNEWQQLPKKWQLIPEEILFTFKEYFYSNYCWFDAPTCVKKAAHPVEAVEQSDSKKQRQRYNFQFQLTEQLPTSCITRNGRIQYKIKFHMRLEQGRSYAGKPIIFEHDQLITIIRTLNPNGMQLYQHTWVFELKNLLKCRLNQACFMPGQSIHFILTLENRRILWLIKSILVELKEFRVHIGWNKNFTKYKKLQTRHTIDRRQLDNIKYSRALFKKQEELQFFDGILKIPTTTIPSSNYPFYPRYKIGLGIFHVINITLKPRHKWMHLFHSDGHGKKITIGTQPLTPKGVELLKRKDDKSISNNNSNFMCLERSEHIPMMQAYIPKYALKETVSIIEQ